MIIKRERENRKWKQIQLDGASSNRWEVEKWYKKKQVLRNYLRRKKKSLLNRTFIPTKSLLPTDVELSIVDMPNEMQKKNIMNN